MSDRTDHYAEAEKTERAARASRGREHAYWMRHAQVHATLALVDAVRALGERKPEPVQVHMTGVQEMPEYAEKVAREVKLRLNREGKA